MIWFVGTPARDLKRLTVNSSTYKLGNKYLGILWNFDICWSRLTRWGVMVRGQHCNFKFPQPRSRTVDSTTLPDVRGKTLLRTAIIAKALRCQRINKQKDASMPIQSTVSDEDFGENSDFLNPPPTDHNKTCTADSSCMFSVVVILESVSTNRCTGST